MDSRSISREQLCAIIDHTNLKPFAGKAEFEKLCAEAAAHHFAMVAINSSPVSLCKQLLKGSGVHVGAAVSFPTGQTTIEAKAFETEDAIANGADRRCAVAHAGAHGGRRADEAAYARLPPVCERDSRHCGTDVRRRAGGYHAGKRGQARGGGAHLRAHLRSGR